MSYCKIQKGFSLIEIMVAFVIGTSSLGLLYKIFSNSNQAIIVSEEYSIATDLAESLISEYSAHSSFLTTYPEGKLNNKFFWKIEYSANTQILQNQLSNAIGLTKITASIHWQSKDKERELLISTIKPLANSQQLVFNE